jgi:hypothetical protein
LTPHGSEFQAGVKKSSRLPSPVPRQSICLRSGTGRSRSHMSYGATVCVDVTGIPGFSRPGSSLNTMSESCLTYIATVRILLTKYIYVDVMGIIGSGHSCGAAPMRAKSERPQGVLAAARARKAWKRKARARKA